MRILDLSRLVPGPYAAELLAERGHEVVKIEEPGRGDPMRELSPAIFARLNRRKKFVSLDLKSEKSIFLKLARRADVVVESFSAGVADKLGVGARAVRRVNRRIVYCSITGYGSKNPAPGHDINFLARAGLLDGREPRVLWAAVVAGLTAAFRILAAKPGERLDLSIQECANSVGFARVPPIPGYGLFPAKDGRLVSVALVEKRFRDALGPGDVAELIRARTADEWDAQTELPICADREAPSLPLPRLPKIGRDNSKFK